MPQFQVTVTVRHHDCDRTTSGTLTNPPLVTDVPAAIERFITVHKLRDRHASDDDDVDPPIISLVTGFRVDGGA